MTTEGSPGDHLRRVVLRIHGTALFVITAVNIAVITIGYNSGTGMYGMLPEQPIGFGGLYQAYAIMFVIGLVLWIGSTQSRPRLFAAVGLLAHVPSLAGNVFFPQVFDQVADGNVGAISVPIHSGFIALEAFALLWKASWFRSPSRTAPIPDDRRG
jgi:hypothetical protein